MPIGCPRSLSGADHAETVAQITVGLGTASWELDLFGRIRSLKSAALEQYLATEQARSATQISLVAAVANTYLALAADRENLRLAQVTLDAQQASYELILRSPGMPASPPTWTCSQAQEPGGSGAGGYCQILRPGGPGRKRAQPAGRCAGRRRPAVRRTGPSRRL